MKLEKKQNSLTVIAEVKTQSPFGFKSDKNWMEQFELAQEIGDIVSVHTNPYWGGSFDLLRYCCKHSSKPILAKGLHVSNFDLLRADYLGAKYILVVGRVIPSENSLSAILLHEPLSLHQLAKWREIPDIQIIWNQRELMTGERKEETFAQARLIFDGWLCQASMLKEKSDINTQADAILVGEHLENFK